jgi:inosine-uridine nucleoside N-ribohydrolase
MPAIPMHKEDKNMIKKPIIIDCDPGIDDAIAISLANSAKNLEIKAITVTAGNTKLENTSMNALALTEYLDIDCHVAKGAAKPMIIPLRTAEHIHGVSGLGTLKLHTPTRAFDKRYAWDAIYETAKAEAGKLTLVALGPVTNIAIALFKYEDLKQYIKEIIMMGGSTTYGNVSAYGEFNIVVDPHAAAAVFRSGIPITMVGLNATEKAGIDKTELEAILSIPSHIQPFLIELMPRYQQSSQCSIEDGVIVDDAIAMAAVINPNIIETQNRFVDVELNSAVSLGRTIVDERSSSEAPRRTKVAYNVNKAAYIDLLKSMMCYYI